MLYISPQIFLFKYPKSKGQPTWFLLTYYIKTNKMVIENIQNPKIPRDSIFLTAHKNIQYRTKCKFRIATWYYRLQMHKISFVLAH